MDFTHENQGEGGPEKSGTAGSRSLQHAALANLEVESLRFGNIHGG